MMRTYDLRDRAQRQPRCHDFFAHRRAMPQDWFWQVHCDIELDHAPIFKPEARVRDDKVYLF